MTATPAFSSALLLIDNLVVGPLGGLGWVDREKEQSVLAALYIAFGIMAGLVWLFSFRLSFLRFEASAERKVRIREAEEYE